MQYSQSTFNISANQSFVKDIWINRLSELGYESFVDLDNNDILAYIQTSQFDSDMLNNALNDFHYEGITYVKTELCEDKDWNEEWEKNYFQPIIINDDCIIHSSFQKPDKAYKYDITINPRMAFGTGHHQTTYMILSYLLSADLQNKALLDMGCGTAVLAILAAKRGAKPLTAIDIDTWCTDNAKENCQLNGVSNIDIITSDAKALSDKHFDIILANINRNILIMDMPKYVSCLNKSGKLVISGFYTEDLPLLEDKAAHLNMRLIAVTEKDHWAMAVFES